MLQNKITHLVDYHYQCAPSSMPVEIYNNEKLF